MTSKSVESVEIGAHLIENGIRVVEVGIDGPLQVLVMSLIRHQSDFDTPIPIQDKPGDTV